MAVTEIPGDAVAGLAVGVPFVALPPSGGPGPGPMIAAWHLLGAPGSEAAMAAALPLRAAQAWRVYLGLPGTGRRPAPPPGAGDLLLDRYAPIIEQAVADFPAARRALRARLPIDDGPVAVIGGSAGGHVALLTLAGGPVPVAAAAVINPAVRAESVVAVNERAGGLTYEWTRQARAKAADLDVIARVARADPSAAVLLVSGEHEYPEFLPDQAALLDALPGAVPARRVTIERMGHMFADEPSLLPAPQTQQSAAVERAIAGWFRQHFPR